MIYEVNGNLRCSMLYDGTAEARLADILLVMEKRTFPKREAEGIVGGPGRLQKLVNKQEVRFECKPNGRCYYNASDILSNAIIKHRKRRDKKTKKDEKNHSKCNAA